MFDAVACLSLALLSHVDANECYCYKVRVFVVKAVLLCFVLPVLDVRFGGVGAGNALLL